MLLKYFSFAENSEEKCGYEKVDYHYKSISVQRFQTPYEKFYMCRLSSKNLVDKIVKNDGYDKSNKLKEIVKIKSSKMNRLPQDLFENFPKMDFLYIKDIEGSFRINRSTFINSSSVTKIWIQGCEFPVIEDSTFAEVINLEFLCLPSNKIETFDETALQGATKLKGLYLKENSIRYLPEQIFRDLPNLEELDVASNLLETVIFDLDICVNLKILILKNNRISAIDPIFLYKKDNLENLYVESNNCINQNFINIKGKLSTVRLEFEVCFRNHSEGYKVLAEIEMKMNRKFLRVLESTNSSNSKLIGVIVMQIVVFLVGVVSFSLFIRLFIRDLRKK